MTTTATRKMISRMVTKLWALSAMIAAQPLCDPQTQYQIDGQCCQMCPPGTSKSPLLDVCATPQCQPCDEDEYQDTYAAETKCKRQPYCDPNKNFQVPESRSKSEKSTCLCKLGFHCSSSACLTCIPHKACEPGWGALVKGNHTHDTVCRQCPNGSFSNRTSWDSDCLTWTKCESGFIIGQSGSTQSDVVCEKNQRQHVVIACVVLLLVSGILLIAAVKIWRSTCREEISKGKNCIEACAQHDRDPPEEAFVALPTTDGGTGVPEENEDGPNQVALLGSLRFSDKGNYVTQENGKAEVLSRQESQSMTVTSEMTH